MLVLLSMTMAMAGDDLRLGEAGYWHRHRRGEYPTFEEKWAMTETPLERWFLALKEEYRWEDPRNADADMNRCYRKAESHWSNEDRRTADAYAGGLLDLATELPADGRTALDEHRYATAAAEGLAYLAFSGQRSNAPDAPEVTFGPNDHLTPPDNDDPVAWALHAIAMHARKSPVFHLEGAMSPGDLYTARGEELVPYFARMAGMRFGSRAAYEAWVADAERWGAVVDVVGVRLLDENVTAKQEEMSAWTPSPEYAAHRAQVDALRVPAERIRRLATDRVECDPGHYEEVSVGISWKTDSDGNGVMSGATHELTRYFSAGKRWVPGPCRTIPASASDAQLKRLDELNTALVALPPAPPAMVERKWTEHAVEKTGITELTLVIDGQVQTQIHNMWEERETVAETEAGYWGDVYELVRKHSSEAARTYYRDHPPAWIEDVPEASRMQETGWSQYTRAEVYYVNDFRVDPTKAATCDRQPWAVEYFEGRSKIIAKELEECAHAVGGVRPKGYNKKTWEFTMGQCKHVWEDAKHWGPLEKP